MRCHEAQVACRQNVPSGRERKPWPSLGRRRHAHGAPAAARSLAGSRAGRPMPAAPHAARTPPTLLRCSSLAVGEDGTVRGAVLINGTPGEPPTGRPWISQLFRHPDARGTGGPLLRRALALATRDGLPALGLAVTHGNLARGLYEAHGFAATLESLTVAL